AAVLSRELGNRLASRITFGDLALLAMIEDRLAAKDCTSGLRTPDAFITSGPDQFALELVQTAHNLQDELAVRRAGIEPRIIERARMSAPAALISSSRFSRSRMERASRSSLVTISVSPGCSVSSAFCRARRPLVLLPDIFSENTLSQLAALSWSIWP